MRHPRIIVEVRSPSNSGEKWENKLFEYRDTQSIEQLVIIESETRYVRSHLRDETGRMQRQPAIIGDGILVFPTVHVEMTLDEIYRRTSLDNESL
jgi:Uma2 family endonuclease